MFRDVILFNKKYSAKPVSMFFICLSTIVVPIGCKYEKFLVHVEGYNLNEICFFVVGSRGIQFFSSIMNIHIRMI